MKIPILLYYIPPESELEYALVIPGKALSLWHHPVEAALVLHQSGHRRQEPAVAQLALVNVKTIGTAHDHFGGFALADVLRRVKATNDILIQQLIYLPYTDILIYLGPKPFDGA